jgi:hypothetical protein
MLRSALGCDLDTNKKAKHVGSRPDGASPIDLERSKERPAGRFSNGQLETIWRDRLYLESKGIEQLNHDTKLSAKDLNLWGKAGSFAKWAWLGQFEGDSLIQKTRQRKE